jgi:hypothetical protein
VELDSFDGEWMGEGGGVVVAAREAQEFNVYHLLFQCEKFIYTINSM